MTEPYVIAGLVGLAAAVALTTWAARLAFSSAKLAEEAQKLAAAERAKAEAALEKLVAEAQSAAQRASKATPEGIGERVKELEDRLALKSVWPSFRDEQTRRLEAKVRDLEERAAELEKAAVHGKRGAA